jgi:hypothetical protein
MANSFEEAKAANRKAVADLADVASQKRQAATKDPGTDTSRIVAERVKREGWSKT